MGYRSDVAYTIRFTTEEAYRLFILEAKTKDLGNCFSDGAECNDEKFQINFEAQNVKWYDSYPEVMMHNGLIALAGDWIESDLHHGIKDGVEGKDEVEVRLGYIFTRIGENTDDVEEDARGEYDWDWVRVSRQIITDWS